MSVYGRNGFLNFIENNIKENTFLYTNSKKSQELSARIQLQLLQRLNSFDFDTIVRKSKNVVNIKFYYTAFSARSIAEMPVHKRIDWLENEVYNSFMNNKHGASPDEFQAVQDLIDELR